MRKGKYYILEGIVGAGKTTQCNRLIEHLEEKYPGRKIVSTREPGGTAISEEIRTIAQGPEYDDEMNCVCEAYLYASSRAQSLRQVVEPVLDEGGIVVADRSFITSLAYQGFSRGMGWERVWEINKAAVNGLLPDKVFFIDVPIEIGLARCFDHNGDKFEGQSRKFFEEAVAGYKLLGKSDLLKDFWVEVDGAGSVDVVFQSICDAIASDL
ncbi:dTMP kinase [Candidatus Dojkabacteria bacterium]|nr:dTMP kinase [Candidatus Dojkabacteria bacterium]